MNYEEFYQDMQVLEKSVKDKLQSTQKSFKKVTNDSGAGDIKNLNKDVSQMAVTLNELKEAAAQLQTLAGSFDAKEYIESGDFARQLVDYCEQFSVDIRGEYPTYEIFPFKVRVDAENQELSINRRKLQCVRPLHFVQDIKTSREKYMKASFNVNMFLNELADAYDLEVVLRGQKNKNIIAEYNLDLIKLYGRLAPTQRARKEYDLNNYAFDLARLYAAAPEIKETKDQRCYSFGPCKNPKNLIRILDQYGNEQFLGTIRFFKPNY